LRTKPHFPASQFTDRPDRKRDAPGTKPRVKRNHARDARYTMVGCSYALLIAPKTLGVMPATEPSAVISLVVLFQYPLRKNALYRPPSH